MKAERKDEANQPDETADPESDTSTGEVEPSTDPRLRNTQTVNSRALPARQKMS